MDDWILGCGPDGSPDRVLHTRSGRLLRLEGRASSFGERPILSGRDGGVADFAGGIDRKLRVLAGLSAPPVYSSGRIATIGIEEVSLRIGAQTYVLPSSPRGWYPPAIWEDSMLWVEDDGAGGEDIWIWSPLSDRGRLLAGGPESQRHVVADRSGAAWIEDEAVVLWDGSLVRRLPAAPVDRLAYSGGVACWSEWVDSGIDIRCSDGASLGRAGNQLWPSVSRNWLLFQEDGQAMLASREPAPELPCTDGESR
jgi:hypothetical protein